MSLINKLNDLKICITADMVKLKNSKLLLLSILGISIFPTLVVYTFFIKDDHFISTMAETGLWEEFINSNLVATSRFLLPFYIILASSLIQNIEHSSDGWKSILCLPYSKLTLFFSKLFTLVFFVFLVFISFGLIIIVLGFVLGLIIEEFLLNASNLPIVYLLEYLFHSFISVLAILSIHNILALMFRNQIPVIGFGLVLIVVSLITYPHELAVYFPFTYSILTVQNTVSGFPIELVFGCPLHELLSLFYFIFFSSLGGLLFYFKEVK